MLADDDAFWPDPAAKSTQLYVILVADPQAMQGPDPFGPVDAAVNGEGARYASIRAQAKGVPNGYSVDWALDFADLPHAAFSPEKLAPMIKQLPSDARELAAQAKLAVVIHSDTKLLPEGNHIRLAGIVPLYVADHYNGVIIDLMARRAWTADGWHSELILPTLSENQLHMVTRDDTGGSKWLMTRGNPKYGVPDLEMRGVAPAGLEAARAQFAVVEARLLARGPSVAPKAACMAPAGTYDGECRRIEGK